MKKPQIKSPQFLTDLYRDLRDKRLLIPMAALLVALVAVPVLLSRDPEPVEAPLTSAEVPEEATAVEAAVLAEQPGIRNYRKRLEVLKERNPFEQRFGAPTEKSVAIKETVETSTDSAAEDASKSITDVSGTDVSIDTSSSSLPASESVTIDESQTTVDETTVAPEPKPDIRFYAGRIDVAVGPVGDAKTVENVRYLDFLPSEKTPVVSFIGVREGAEHAVFSVNPDVIETRGEGSCSPKKAEGCQFLDLKIGEERVFEYGPDGTTYRLKLLDTHIVRVPDPRD